MGHPFYYSLDTIEKQLTVSNHPPIISLPTVDSTNAWLKQAASDNAPHMQILLAAAQSAGRGRLGRSFFSPEGTGLYLSIVYDDKFNPELNNYLTMAAGVVVYEAIAELFRIDTQLKWVNDIYYQDRKVGGILAEHIVKRNTEGFTVLGIGLNLFEPVGGFPAEIIDIAGALFKNKKDCSDDLLYRFIARLIEKLWALGQSSGSENYINIYIRQSWVLNRKVVLTQGNEKIIGIVKGFNDSGHLILEKENGKTEVFYGGEITLRIADAQCESGE